ncbi:MAG: GDSL-type esterase/lipase family protein [Campylobacterota bacterium]|nr:GDSL-type esterase/lipase family protein [Campylobacterota bacterium]
MEAVNFYKKILFILLFITGTTLFSDTFRSPPSNNIVMLGDSITKQVSWKKLINRNNIINLAQNGADTINLTNQIYNLKKRKTNKAFILIGINDIIKDRSIEAIFINIKSIIEELKKQNIEPILQSILYLPQRYPHSYTKKISKLNNMLKKYSQKQNIKYIDINRYFSKNKTLKQKYIKNGIGLNKRAHNIWAATLKPHM